LKIESDGQQEMMIKIFQQTNTSDGIFQSLRSSAENDWLALLPVSESGSIIARILFPMVGKNLKA
jgi:hypothetical protein